MLADLSRTLTQAGTLGKEVHRPAAFLHELLDFIADELPRWRDRPGRPRETSETVLTSQLCAHLSSSARLSPGWDILQFRTEVPDEVHKGRKIDLMPASCGVRIWIEGRTYTDFDPLLPIECKRLPTPNGRDRDEREYVFSRFSTTGGMQRFKAAYHGAAHSLGAIIGYLQEQTVTYWSDRVGQWISELACSQPGWSEKDLLHLDCSDETAGLAVFSSSHERASNLGPIELRHLWLRMS